MRPILGKGFFSSLLKDDSAKATDKEAIARQQSDSDLKRAVSN
jgi:hypothetical protein